MLLPYLSCSAQVQVAVRERGSHLKSHVCTIYRCVNALFKVSARCKQRRECGVYDRFNVRHRAIAHFAAQQRLRDGRYVRVAERVRQRSHMLRRKKVLEHHGVHGRRNENRFSQFHTFIFVQTYFVLTVTYVCKLLAT
jgi:hypothetical protein